MDLAAQRISSLAQRILPDRPHHLALSPNRRYPVPPDFLEHHSNLQYSTFLSDTDRGILLTRPYYEIREEPESRATSPASAAPRQEAKKAVTKMSFKDYQNSKKKLSLSPSDALAKGEPRLSHADESKFAFNGASRTPDGNKRKAVDVPASAGSTPREELNKRPRLPSRERPHRNGRTPSPGAGRRSPDHPDSSRSLKKVKVESTSKRDISRTPKHEPAIKHNPGSVDRSAHKDSRPGALQSANGRPVPATQRNGELSVASPPSKSSLNGPKSSSISTSGARRAEPPAKPAVPPLLSPLRLSLDDDRGSRGRSPSRRPAEPGVNSKTAGRNDRSEGGGIVPPRKHKSPLRIPPLLSPTLPAVVEEELARELARSKKPPIKVEGGPTPSKGLGGQGDSQAEEDRPKSLRVVLKYKKRNSLRVQRLLALQPASLKEALKKERSMSVEASPPAKKRPRPTEVGSAGVESGASKRPKTSMDTISVTRPPAPSTPLKTATAMSRAASSNSQAQTPGDGTGLTPGAHDRPPTSHDGDGGRASSAGSLMRRSKEYTALGTQLKHRRDDILRPPTSSIKIEGGSGLSTADRKRVAALSLEMVMSYMVAFEAINQARSLDRKVGDFATWESLLPHLGELKAFTRGFRPLDGLRLQLHAIVLEELVRVYYHHDLSAVGVRLQHAGRKIHDIWVDAHSCVSSISDGPMKADVGPWTKPGGAAAAALHVLRRWVDRENVEWRPMLILPATNGI